MSVASRALVASSLALITTASVVAAADPSPSVTVTPPWQSLEPTAVFELPNARGVIPLATDGTTVWAVGANQLLRIDSATNASEYLEAPVAADDTGLLLADDGLWATRWASGKVYRLDPATGNVELEVAVPSAVNPQSVGDEIWIGRERQRDMVQVDRVTGALGDHVPGSAGAMGSPDSIWYVRPGVRPSLTRVDPVSGEVVATIELPEAPPCKGVQLGGQIPEALYAGCAFGDDATSRPFSRIDPSTNSVATTTVLPATHGASAVALDGQVWLAGDFRAADGAFFGGLVRVDPVTGAAERWVSLGSDIGPSTAVAAGGAIWVGADSGQRVLRYDVASLVGP
jgi:streptogramin lyase